MRAKIFYVQCEDIVRIFNWKQGQFVTIPELNLPKGYSVRKACYDFGHDAIGLLIEHPSFDEIEPGYEYPRANGIMHLTFQLKEPKS